MQRTLLTPSKKRKDFACRVTIYSDSMGFNIGKRPSLYSDKHGGVKVKLVRTGSSLV